MNRAALLTNTLNTSLLRLAGQAIALVSVILISSQFGASQETDDYYAGLIVPVAVMNLVVSMLTNLFAPVYLDHIHRDPAEQKPILGSMTFIAAIALIGGLTISLVALPFSVNLRDLSSAESIARAMLFGLPIVVIVPIQGLSRILGAICEAHGNYTAPAAVSAVSPLIFVTSLVISRGYLGAFGLVVSSIAAGAAELVVIGVYAVRRLHLPLMPRPAVHSAVREMLLKSLTPGMTYFALLFVPTFDRIAASTVDAGGLTAFHYGDRLIAVIDVLITGSVITVLTNYWAKVAAEKGADSILHSLNEVFSLLSFVVTPFTVGGALLSRPIVSVIFERGAFHAVEASAQVFAVLLLSLVFNYLVVLMVRLLLIVRDTRAQAILSITVSALNAILNIVFAPVLGLLGIVLSTLITRTIVCGLAYVFVRRRFPKINLAPVMPRAVRTLLTTAIMASIVVIVKQPLMPALARENGLLWQCAALGGTVILGAMTYLGAALLIRHPDVAILYQMIAGTPYGRFLRPFIRT